MGCNLARPYLSLRQAQCGAGRVGLTQKNKLHRAIKNIRLRKLAAALSLVATAAALATTGYSQATSTTTTTTTTTSATPSTTQVSSPQGPNDQEPTTLEKFVVTGTYLPMSADAPAIPVTTVDITAIQNSGEANNLMEVLQKVQPQFTGGLNLGPTNGNVSS